jgi:GGDEF domain-containing protein
MNDLSSHDGLHDALTGALTLPAFYEAVTREIARARRDPMQLHLLLLNLLPINQGEDMDCKSSKSSKSSKHRKNAIDQEQLLVALIELVHELQISLRENDLISRTGLSEVSIVFSGNAEDLKKRVLKIANDFSATVAMVQYQENWKLAQFLTAGDLASQEAVRAKTLK